VDGGRSTGIRETTPERKRDVLKYVYKRMAHGIEEGEEEEKGLRSLVCLYDAMRKRHGAVRG
jgi:hypothetical protein